MFIKTENENAAIIELLVELNVRMQSIDGKLFRMITADSSNSETSSLVSEFEEARQETRTTLRKALNWNFGDYVEE